MNQIEHLWETGEATPFDLSSDEIMAFKRATGSVGVVGLRWIHDGQVHQTSTCATVLPDKSGVAMVSKWTGKGTNWMEVINADGSLRFRLVPPPLGDRMDHTHAVLEAPRAGWPASGIAFGVQAGYKDKVASASFGNGTDVVSIGVLLDIDWRTGALKDWQVIPPFV